MPEHLDHFQNLKSQALQMGGVLFGVADLAPLEEKLLLSDSEKAGLCRGIVIGTILSPSVLAGIEDQPTLLYKWHYRQANNLLDQMAFRLSQIILKEGFKALPVPASQVIDWVGQKGAASHRLLAEAAGLGWRGRNNLLVTPEYGAQLRLVSVLTDMPLQPGTPMESACGECRRCVKACPAQALGETHEEYSLERCNARLKTFAKLPGIGHNICGVCVKACGPKKFST